MEQTTRPDKTKPKKVLTTAVPARRRAGADAAIGRQLQAAEHHCLHRGASLTAQRRDVLELLLRRGGAAKAYDLQHDLQARGTGRVAPTTIYRALEFLIEQRLVHRVDAFNTFVVCNCEHGDHRPLFLVCERCESVRELHDHEAADAVARRVQQAGGGFLQSAIEVKGVCPACQADERPRTDPAR